MQLAQVDRVGRIDAIGQAGNGAAIARIDCYVAELGRIGDLQLQCTVGGIGDRIEVGAGEARSAGRVERASTALDGQGLVQRAGHCGTAIPGKAHRGLHGLDDVVGLAAVDGVRAGGADQTRAHILNDALGTVGTHTDHASQRAAAGIGL